MRAALVVAVSCAAGGIHCGDGLPIQCQDDSRKWDEHRGGQYVEEDFFHTHMLTEEAGMFGFFGIGGCGNLIKMEMPKPTGYSCHRLRICPPVPPFFVLSPNQDLFSDMETLKFIDLCAGIGGFHWGLHEASEHFNDPNRSKNPEGRSSFLRKEGLRFQCVLSSELDEQLREVYVKNFPEVAEAYQVHYAQKYRQLLVQKEAGRVGDEVERVLDIFQGMFNENGSLSRIHGNISQLLDEDVDNCAGLDEPHLNKGALLCWPGTEDPVIPEFDLLCAGFPCQPFSKSGKQGGFTDPRGTVWNMIRIILQHRRPRYVLLENVGNFAGHNEGKTWQRVRKDLEAVGYGFIRATELLGQNGSGLLSPHQFGYPHHRERFFIIAVRDEQDFRNNLSPFPDPKQYSESNDEDLQNYLGKRPEPNAEAENQIYQQYIRQYQLSELVGKAEVERKILRLSKRIYQQRCAETECPPSISSVENELRDTDAAGRVTEAIKAGNDMVIIFQAPGRQKKSFTRLIAAMEKSVQEGTIDSKFIDASVLRILQRKEQIFGSALYSNIEEDINTPQLLLDVLSLNEKLHQMLIVSGNFPNEIDLAYEMGMGGIMFFDPASKHNRPSKAQSKIPLLKMTDFGKLQ